MSLGLVKYDAMCMAISECHHIDEVKELRNKAKALEVYAAQAKNVDAERKASEIRIRAERRAGELLRDMKQTGQRENGHAPLKKVESRGATPPPKLSDLGISRDQSSKWQQLAAVPKTDFERAVRGDGPKPTTEGIVNAHLLRENPMPQMDPDALWFWGRLRDFERNGILNRDRDALIDAMTDSMTDDCSRILPRVIDWMKGKSANENRRTA